MSFLDLYVINVSPTTEDLYPRINNTSGGDICENIRGGFRLLSFFGGVIETTWLSFGRKGGILDFILSTHHIFLDGSNWLEVNFDMF